MNAIFRPARGLTALLAALAAGAVAGTALAAEMEMTPALKALAAAADKEGELLVQWGGSSFGGAKGVDELAADVNAAFGTNLKFKWIPGGSFPKNGNDIAMALRNNLPSPTDVYQGFSRNMAIFDRQDMFISAPWADYLPDRMSDKYVERGKFVKIYSGTTGFSYNTEMAPSVPERLADFLKPEWKGKYATTAFGAGFEQLAAKEAWGPARTVEYGKKFAAGLAGFMLCQEPERLASGEFLAFVTDCSGGQMLRAAKDGAPIKRVIAPDVPLVSYFYFAVPKNAVHPNAAKLFLVWVASKRGQAYTYETNLADVHLYPESQTRKEIEAVETRYEIKFKSADIDWQETNAAGNAAQREVVKIFKQSSR